MILSNLFIYAKSIFLFKKSAYVILSFVLTVFALVFKAIFKNKLNFLLVKFDDEQFILIVLASSLSFTLTFIVVLFEMITDYMVIKHQKLHDNIRYSHIKESIFKMIFYGLWIFMIFVLQIFSYAVEYTTIVSILGYVMFFSATLINLYEYKSIGKNIENRFNRKYRIFTFLSTLTDIIEKKIGTKLENSFCPKDNEIL